uniref:Uncharacterized protein n=1 Tax=Chelonoidis abingdonii TaxID=106734 RepID=A0A8C0QP53_CHEAB
VTALLRFGLSTPPSPSVPRTGPGAREVARGRNGAEQGTGEGAVWYSFPDPIGAGVSHTLGISVPTSKAAGKTGREFHPSPYLPNLCVHIRMLHPVVSFGHD